MSGMWSMGLVVAKQKKRLIKILLTFESAKRRYYYRMHGPLVSFREFMTDDMHINT
jgi:hypothetical protein